ncbi:conjugal transfer protein TraG (plasmid) [Shewanella sp. SNU WT4]|uniref:type IV secretory system conjugative DNA transfer family protein n=1 Tax=Shewanella sp. SNU WT4 TaxID=2590015 RepID=UPI00112DAE00|nr:type IV secretory system conjugative DNA transfer family protein [Shewanella sp. SNU WT4]QDF68707.1 conjugal transfer protein TraG [Shewanella sp. SNU WT4]
MTDKYNNTIKAQSRTQQKYPNALPLTACALSIPLSLQIATQRFAENFGYQAVLGSNIDGWYAPWKIIQWFHQYYAVYPTQTMSAATMAIPPLMATMASVLAYNLWQQTRAKSKSYLHGSARWANKQDIINAGLLPESGTTDKEGVIVGSWIDPEGKQHYLVHTGAEHILCYAPTRSGKGIGLVIPTLLTWQHSALITDLKGELWALTAGYRKHIGQHCLKFEPASRNTVCWNPLEEIRVGTDFETGDIQNICTLIVDPEGKGLKDHWQKTSFSLLCGLVAHIIYKSIKAETVATLPMLDAILASPNRNISELWTEMVDFAHTEDKETGEIWTHPLVAAAGQDMIDREEREAGSVLSSVKSYLVLYRDPVVAAAIGKSEFKIRDLMNSDKPVSLYLVTQPTDKDRLKPLIRIMMNMIVRLLADGLEFKDGRPIANYNFRLLGMIDEFPSLGKLDILQESLAFVAGYGIKFYLITQDLNQLKSPETGYGKDEQITSNCHIQNAYPPGRIETAEHLARCTGETTIMQKQISTSSKGWIGGTSTSVNYQPTKRTLLTPDECMRLPAPVKQGKDIVEAGDMIIYVAGYPAIYGKQLLYFKDPVYLARAQIPAPEQTDRLIEVRGNATIDAINQAPKLFNLSQ